MSRQKQSTRVKLVKGKVLVEKADGTTRDAEDRTDRKRMAEEDGTAGNVPLQVRVTMPFEPAE